MVHNRKECFTRFYILEDIFFCSKEFMKGKVIKELKLQIVIKIERFWKLDSDTPKYDVSKANSNPI